MTNKGSRLAGAAAIIMSATIISRITGFFREMLIPAKMGKEAADAYYIAFLLPDLMNELLVGGAVAAALIPILAGFISNDREEDGWKAAGTFINIIIILMLFFTVIGIIFTPSMLNVVASGFKAGKIEQYELAVRLTRIMFPSVGFLMLAGLCNGILNSYHKFAVAAYGPVIYNLGSIISILLFGSKSPELTAYGVMASAFIFFAFQFAFSFKHFKFYRPTLFLKSEEFKKLINLAIPSLLASTIVQVNIIISKSFATKLAAGRVTALQMADRTWRLPLGIFAQSIGVAMLPSLSAHYATKNYRDYKKTLYQCLKTVLLFSIPSTFGLLVLSQSVIRTIFMFGKVDEAQVKVAAGALFVYSIALIYQSVVLIMNRAYYSSNDTKTPLYIGIVTIIINYLLNVIFINKTGFDVYGMALAFVISNIINSFLLVLIFGKKIKSNIISDIFSFLVKVFGASLAMAAVIYLLNLIMPFSNASKIGQIIYLSVETIIGAFVYLFLVLLMKVEEARYAVRTVLKKFIH